MSGEPMSGTEWLALRDDARRAAYLEMAEECERRAAEIDEGQGRVMPVEAAQPLESLAAWARGRAGA